MLKVFQKRKFKIHRTLKMIMIENLVFKHEKRFLSQVLKQFKFQVPTLISVRTFDCWDVSLRFLAELKFKSSISPTTRKKRISQH